MELKTITINNVTYKKGEYLGQGGFGSVYKATNKTDRTDKQAYAIKILQREFNEDDKAEIKLLGKLKHDNICNYVDSQKIKVNNMDCFAIVMLYAGKTTIGQTVGNYNKVHGANSFPEKRLIKYLRQVLSAVDYLRSLKITHRDLKIGNILIDENDNAQIIDFGLSRQNKHSMGGSISTQGGTMCFLAPEVYLYGKGHDCQADLFSIGVLFYFLMSNHFPWDDSVINLYYKKIEDGIVAEEFNSSVRQQYSKGLQNLIRYGFLQYDKLKRPKPKEVLKFLELDEKDRPKRQEILQFYTYVIKEKQKDFVHNGINYSWSEQQLKNFTLKFPNHDIKEARDYYNFSFKNGKVYFMEPEEYLLQYRQKNQITNEKAQKANTIKFSNELLMGGCCGLFKRKATLEKQLQQLLKHSKKIHLENYFFGINAIMKGMKQGDFQIILDKLRVYVNICKLDLDLREYSITSETMKKLIRVVINSDCLKYFKIQLDQVSFQQDQMNELAHSLKNQNFVHSAEFCLNGISLVQFDKESLITIAKDLEGKGIIQLAGMKFKQMSDIVEAIEKRQLIVGKEYEFKRSEFGDQNLKAISTGIQTHGDLKKIQLELQNSQITDQGLKSLAEAFRHNGKMKEVVLNVENTNVGPDAAKEIILAFKNNKAISSAIFNFKGTDASWIQELTRQKMGKQELSKLIEFVETGGEFSLYCLSPRRNYKDDNLIRDVKKLQDHGFYNKVNISIRGTKVGKNGNVKGMNALAQACAANPFLSDFKINLNFSGVTNEAVKGLLKGFKKHKLKRFTLWLNKQTECTGQILEDVANMLKTKKSLKYVLILHGNWTQVSHLEQVLNNDLKMKEHKTKAGETVYTK